jgi:lysozyme
MRRAAGGDRNPDAGGRRTLRRETVKLDEAGISFLKAFEGCRLVAYRDKGGVWTISWGVTGPRVQPEMRITIAQAEQMFRDALAPREAAVNRLVKVALTQNEYTALVSLFYNVGIPRTLIRKLNAGDRAGAAGEFDRWVHYTDIQTGYKLIDPVLVARRGREKALFLKAVG